MWFSSDLEKRVEVAVDAAFAGPLVCRVPVVQDDQVSRPDTREDGGRHLVGAAARMPVADRHRPLDEGEAGVIGAGAATGQGRNEHG